MKKNLQVFAVALMAMFIFTNLGHAQFAEKSNTKPTQVELSSKDADLLWGANWQDPATSTNGIVNTKFGGLPGNNLTITADDIVVPEGKKWAVTSVWARGFLAGADGVPFALPDGFGVRIYADNNDLPGDLVIDHLIEMPGMDHAAPTVDFATPLELTAGKYWVAVYGYFASSTESATGRWNQYMWNPDPAVGSKAKLRDYANVFGIAADGWRILQDDLGIQFTAVDFAVWGTESDDDNGNGDEFAVTFVVDMTNAIAHDNVVFDPEIHRVFIAGSFPEWEMPGSNDAFELFPMVDAKDVEVIFYENFSGGAVPEGWLNLDDDGDGNMWFIVGESHTPVDGDHAIASASWQNNEVLTPDNWLITPQIQGVQDDWVLSFYVKAQDPAWAAETFDVLISTQGSDITEFTSIHNETLESGEWGIRELDLADFAGEDIYIAFRHWDSSDWFQIVLDAIKVEGTPGGGEPGDDIFYSITLDLPAGDIAYKFFLVEDEATWDIGEWAGAPDRTATISEDVTIEHKFGFPISVHNVLFEEGMRLFPNPVRNTLTVQNSANINEVRIFDLTGRLVMSQAVNGNEAYVNVSEFKQGVYIMQVISANGVAAQKFNVVK